MPVPGLDGNACARRNAKAALEGRAAAPFRLSAVPPPPIPDGFRLVTASGTLPANDDAAVASINANLGLTGADALTRDKVLLVYPEAANRNYISKYCMFLGLSTLKNIAAAGADGISLMNSHRTGGMSQPTELPYGRTFCSRLETLAAPDGTRDHRVILGAYMIAGLKPNGANGPSTDDLHAAIQGGTLAEVSLGFSDSGKPFCDVCGRDMDELDEEGDYLCNHVPGTHRGMDADMVAAQKARGVPDGVATFTLEDSHVNELSAVYAGALPGAAFRKASRLARKGQMTATELGEARSAFAPLLTAAPDAFGPVPRLPIPESEPDPKKGNPVDPKITLADAYAFWDATGRPQIALADLQIQIGGNPTPPAPNPNPVTDPPALRPANSDPVFARQLASMREEMDAKTRQFAAERAKDRQKAVALEADQWVDSMIRLNRATAAERSSLVATYSQSAADDDANPVQLAFKDAEGKPTQGGRLEAFKAGISVRPDTKTGNRVVAGNPGGKNPALNAGNPNANDLPAEPPPSADDLDRIYQLGSDWAKKRNGPATGGPKGLAAAR